eukprot:5251936-Pleurochrysis_carterae.AAC.1
MPGDAERMVRLLFDMVRSRFASPSLVLNNLWPRLCLSGEVLYMLVLSAVCRLNEVRISR